MKNIPIGVEDFLLANKQYYVDKTLIIKDIIDNCLGKSVLITRPRRFGKSLTLSMIDYFFDNKGDYKQLFIDKKIFKENEKYLSYLNKIPVIHLNMKNISSNNVETMLFQTVDIISNEYRKFIELKDSNELLEIEKKEFIDVINKNIDNPYLYIDSIKKLTYFLYKHYNSKPIILIDEYDTPLEGSYQNDFYDDAIGFFKKFYSATLKSNDYMFFSITTGVLEIAKESIFSDLNNLNVCSVLDDDFKYYFGFTEDEVKKMLIDFNINVSITDIKKWYAGYGSNTNDIYNPWSILNFINKEKFLSYWVNTGSNLTIISLIQSIPNSIELLNKVINDKTTSFKFNNSISYKDIKNDNETLFSYLIQTGYLTAEAIDLYGNYILKIPNLEIEEVFKNEIIARGINKNHLDLANKLKLSIVNKDTKLISNILKDYIIESYSYYDLNKEKDYQIMLVGILAVLFSDYIVKSEVVNKNGRCDIMISPKFNNDLGIIIEIKKYQNRLSNSRLEAYSNKALEQIKTNKYFSELKLREARKILLYSFVFDDYNNVINSLELTNKE